jgi:hypothetical protein
MELFGFSCSDMVDVPFRQDEFLAVGSLPCSPQGQVERPGFPDPVKAELPGGNPPVADYPREALIGRDGRYNQKP